MEVIAQEIKDLLVIKPILYKDLRGVFLESFNKLEYEKIGIKDEFIQDNQSFSNKGVLRGLHFQYPPFSQAKLIRVIKGAVLDVAVDIRRDSSTFGKWCAVELSEDNNFQFWIPVGFAHGFVALVENTILQYKCTNYYSCESEASIIWDDPFLNIDWGIKSPVLSEKDKKASFFKDIVPL